jgi:hypothetical protein
MSKENTIKEAAEAFTAALISLLLAATPAPAAAEAPPEEEKVEITVASLKALAKTKDPEAVAKLLKKLGIKSYADVEDTELESVHEKLTAMADIEGAAEEEKKEEGGNDEIGLDTLRELAKKAIKNGKSSDLKKLIAKFGTESISDMDEKHFAKFHPLLVKLAE